MRNRLPLFFVLSLAGVPLLGGAAGCSGNESPRDQFVDQLCQLFEPCCDSVGMSLRGQDCKSWSYWQGPAYHADAGSACLSAMQSLQAGGTLCNGLPAPCFDALGPEYGTAPAGGACAVFTDCDPGVGGSQPACAITSIDADGGETGVCVQMSKGKAGDGPCVESFDNGVTTGSWPSNNPLHAVTCDANDGLYCDFSSFTCKQVKNPGDPCAPTSNAPECGELATCTGVLCTARLASGTPCDPSEPTCGGNLYCDSGTRMCTPMRALGAACTLDEQCPGQCVRGHCASPAERWICNAN